MSGDYMQSIIDELNGQVNDLYEEITQLKTEAQKVDTLTTENARLRDCGWIKVNERLPEDSRDVFYWLTDRIRVGFYSDGMWYCRDGKPECQEWVTMWHESPPNPVPPSDGTGEVVCEWTKAVNYPGWYDTECGYFEIRYDGVNNCPFCRKSIAVVVEVGEEVEE